jgi:copper chaperone CopZ
MANEVELAIEGMSCAGCEANLRFALSSLAGVTQAKADFRAKKVEVAYDPSLTGEEELRRTIEDMGYTVVV